MPIFVLLIYGWAGQKRIFGHVLHTLRYHNRRCKDWGMHLMWCAIIDEHTHTISEKSKVAVVCSNFHSKTKLKDRCWNSAQNLLWILIILLNRCCGLAIISHTLNLPSLLHCCTRSCINPWTFAHLMSYIFAFPWKNLTTSEFSHLFPNELCFIKDKKGLPREVTYCKYLNFGGLVIMLVVPASKFDSCTTTISVTSHCALLITIREA